MVVFSGWLGVTLLAGSAQAQGAAGFPACMPAAQPAAAAGGGRGPAAAAQGQPAQANRGGAAARVPRETASPPSGRGRRLGSVEKSVAGRRQRGRFLADKDGNALVAQEDFDAVLKLDKDDKASVLVSNAKGVGSLSMDRQGRLYGAHRTERPGSTKLDQASIVNAISILSPDRKMVATKWADGTTLTVRPNDLAADGQGGAYFTSGCVYYASANAAVTVVADNIRTNGIVFSPDDKILYVTNGGAGQTPGTIVAFDVKGPGVLAHRRDFATPRWATVTGPR